MKDVRIYLKGWANSRLYTDAVNHDDHELHAEAMAVHLRSYQPYKPGDVVYLAVQYPVLDDTLSDMAICEQAFERFNVGDPKTDKVVAIYRAGRNRSLSVGDLVVIDGTAYTCASVGWEQVEFTFPDNN